MSKYYKDGITKVTDPFYICICPNGHKHWECIYVKRCAICGAKLIRCIPANLEQKKEQSAND